MAPDDRPRRDPDSVYRVVRLVASDTTSWEAAAAAAIDELAKSITDLRVARVTELDTVVRDGVRLFRVKLEASYRIDRRRTTETGGTKTVKRILLVVNKSVGSGELDAIVAARCKEGPKEFHVVIPTPSVAWAAGLGMDPLSGYADSDSVTAVRQQAEADAQARLDDQLARLRAVGVGATGEIGPADPLAAIANVLERSSFDEIIVSTLPASVSRWLGRDLPKRIERTFRIPVTHVEQRSE